MNSAQLRMETLEFYSPKYKDNGFGVYEDPKDWEFEHTARAGLLNQSMNRAIEADEVVFNKVRTFIVRTYVKVNDNWRIKWNNSFWQIESIVENKYYLDKEIVCSKIDE